MYTQETYLSAADATPLFVRTWGPEHEGEPVAPTAVIQLVHGMAEHSGRYEAFARAAVKAGYAVVADDHRGHGRTSTPVTRRARQRSRSGLIRARRERSAPKPSSMLHQPAPLGHTHDRDGWSAVLADLSVVRDFISSQFPGVPVILFGHSWGSLLVRGWLAQHTEDAQLAGAIVMGTAGNPGVLGGVGVALGRGISRLRGPQYHSLLLESQAFAAHNKPFSPARTDFDWLSRDTTEVDRYIADPLCGQHCSAAFYRDLALGARTVSHPRAFASLPREVPILVTSGEEDPVGGMGRGVRDVAEKMAGAGVRRVTVRLYAGARHELLNELNRDEVTHDILDWISSVLVDSHKSA